MMLRYLLVAESLTGARRTDPHRYAAFMCGMSAMWRRVGNWFH